MMTMGLALVRDHLEQASFIAREICPDSPEVLDQILAALQALDAIQAPEERSPGNPITMLRVVKAHALEDGRA